MVREWWVTAEGDAGGGAGGDAGGMYTTVLLLYNSMVANHHLETKSTPP